MTEEEKRAASHQGGALGETAPASVETQQARRLGNQAQVLGAKEAEELNHRWAAYRDIANRPDADPADRAEAAKRAEFTGNLLQSRGGLKKYTTNEPEHEPGMDTFSRNYADAATFGAGGGLVKHLLKKSGVTPEEQQSIDRADTFNDLANRGSAIAGSVTGSGALPNAVYGKFRGAAQEVLGGVASRAKTPVGRRLAQDAAAIGTELVPTAATATTGGLVQGFSEDAPDLRQRFINAAIAGGQAARDPSTYALGLGAGALSGLTSRAGMGVVGSKGGMARELLEEGGGEGIKVGPMGVRGGVFENELKGVKPEAGARDVKNMLAGERAQAEREWTQPYKLDRDAIEAEAMARAKPIAKEQYDRINRQFDERAQEAANLRQRAYALTENMPPDQDIEHVISALKAESKHPRSFEAMPTLDRAITFLEGFREKPSTILGPNGKPVSAGGRVTVTPAILDELQTMLSGKSMAGFGQRDNMVGKQFPLAQAAGQVREMNEGSPFGGAREKFTEAYQGRKEGRIAAGLPEDLPRRLQTDLNTLENQEYGVQKHSMLKEGKAMEAEGKAQYQKRVEKAQAREQELANLQGARSDLTLEFNPFKPKSVLTQNPTAIAGRFAYGPAKAVAAKGFNTGAATIGAAREFEKDRSAARADALIPTLMIDRIEHGKAVLVDEDGNEKVVPRMSLPKGAQAGGWIRGGSIVPAPKSESQAIRKKLSAGDTGGRIDLNAR